MPDDYYSAPESGVGETSDAGDVKASKPQGDDENEMDGDSALVSKSVFKGKIPDVGQECRFKVAHLFEDEVELEWVDDKGDYKSDKGKRSTMDESVSAFDKMSGPSEAEE